MLQKVSKLNQKTKHNHHTIGIGVMIITVLFLNQFIDLNSVGQILNQFQTYFTENLVIGILIYLLMSIIILNTPVSITPIIYILSGFLYGIYFGTFLSVLGVTIGSFIGFEIIRIFFRKKFQNKYKNKISKINKEIEFHGFHYFFTLRTIVVVPHYLINILAGLSKLNKKTFTLASICGFLPEAIVYNYAGSTLTNLTNINQIISKEIIFALSLIVLLGIIPGAQKLIRNHKIKKEKVLTFSDKPISQ